MDSRSRASLIAIVIAVALASLVAWTGSIGGATVGGVPLFALAVATTFAIQVIVYVPSMLAKTERFFDLTGSLTFIVVTVGLLLLSPVLDARNAILAAMVIVWAARLGTFLFVRIHRSGSDDRFDELKTSPIRFLRVWVLQGLWVSLTAAAAWIAMSGDTQSRPLGWLAIIGIAVWLIGIGIEIVADLQKSAFKADPSNQGDFIRSGLWSRSRHPNYFGEILLWIGVTLVAAPVLSGWQWVALISPVFVIVLLTRVSGIPLLEAKADRRWGGDDDYAAYKKRTPTLIPRFSR